ncbi:MAG: sigma-70 family RNA polymerase sigma factor [Deltaproteobacteria bacterium]|nr:sigma-70 family RNA polymerase sigma factor [Deltaproteobacteria bacterium]
MYEQSGVEVEEAYRRLWPIIRAKCARMLADPAEAEDVAQATFERLWRARLMEEDVKTVSAWIYRTSTRLAIDQLRRRKVRERGPAAPEAPSLHDQAIARATLADIALRVPKRELRTVVLHRVDGLTQPEVAEVLGISERSVRRHLVRFDARRFER